MDLAFLLEIFRYNSLFFNLFTCIFNMYGYFDGMCVCVPHVCRVLGGQQRASHPLELGLTVVICRVGAANEPGSSGRADKCSLKETGQ